MVSICQQRPGTRPAVPSATTQAQASLIYDGNNHKDLRIPASR
jgi:hypothetical protein